MSSGLWVLVAIFLGTAVLGAPVGQCMIAAGIGYFLATHQDVGLVVDQTMNGFITATRLVPLFIFVANDERERCYRAVAQLSPRLR